MKPIKQFDPEKAVKEYLARIAKRDTATSRKVKAEHNRKAQEMRDRWKQWNGDDERHEVAFGEPEE